MSIKISLGLNLVCDVLNSSIYVSTLLGESVVMTYVYHFCSMLFMGF